MKSSYSAAAILAIPIFFATIAHAQIDMAALAQFKYNQQQALAKGLAKNLPDSKHPRRKASAALPALIDKPVIIHANNRKFKSIYSDTHKSNVR